MSRLIQVAWMLPALWLLLFAARVAVADLRQPRRDDGRQSWSVPEQRQGERLSGRF